MRWSEAGARQVLLTLWIYLQENFGQWSACSNPPRVPALPLLLSSNVVNWFSADKSNSCKTLCVCAVGVARVASAMIVPMCILNGVACQLVLCWAVALCMGFQCFDS